MLVAIPTPHKFVSLYREILQLSHSAETESLEAKKSMKDILVFRAVCCLSLSLCARYWESNAKIVILCELTKGRDTLRKETNRQTRAFEK